MKFNIDDYKGKYAMHCQTEEEAKDFCNYLHSVGKKWGGGSSYLNKTLWDIYYSNTVYYFNDGLYGNISNAKFYNYTILEWSDFMNKEFTKADLTGDVVEFRNEDVGIVNGELNTIIARSTWYDLNNYKDDLTSVYGYEQYDVMAVRRPKVKGDCQFDAIKYDWGTLVYERKEVEEMTLEEICRLLGKEIKIVK